MKVTAWNNGQHSHSGAGYGIKLNASDRDRYFRREWDHVVVLLPNGVEIRANTNKKSFWGTTCRELINKGIGQWFRSNGYAPWEYGNPPYFELTHVSDNVFKLDNFG